MRWLRPKRPRIVRIHHGVYTSGAKRLPLGLRLQMMLARRRVPRVVAELAQERVLPSIYMRAGAGDIDGIVVDGDRGAVGQFVPTGFEAYAWLPNPAWKWTAPGAHGAIENFIDDHEGGLWARPVKWIDVATASGLDMHRETRWSDISGPTIQYGNRAVSPEQEWTWGPREGTLEPFVAESLFNLLSRWTQPGGRCLSGKWEGAVGREWRTDVKLATPHWDYFIWACKFGDLGEWLAQPDTFERSEGVPHVLWPASREWFIANLYSGHSNYLAGSRELIEAVMNSSLEAYEVELSDRSWPAGE